MPRAIAEAGVRDAIAHMRDLVIVDTAGRLHIDEEMMAEAARHQARDQARPGAHGHRRDDRPGRREGGAPRSPSASTSTA